MDCTAVLAANLSPERREMRVALADGQTDRVAVPRITAAALAHLLLGSRHRTCTSRHPRGSSRAP